MELLFALLLCSVFVMQIHDPLAPSITSYVTVAPPGLVRGKFHQTGNIRPQAGVRNVETSES